MVLGESGRMVQDRVKSDAKYSRIPVSTSYTRTRRNTSPYVFILMIPVGLGHQIRHNRFKYLLGLIAVLIFIQYLFGVSVYKVDVRVWKYSPARFWSSSSEKESSPSLVAHVPVPDQLDQGGAVKPDDTVTPDKPPDKETVEVADVAQVTSIEPTSNSSVIDDVNGNVTTALIDAVTSNNSSATDTVTSPSPSATQKLNVTATPSSSKTSDIVTFAPANKDLQECPLLPPVLVGPIKVWFDYPSFDELSKLYPFLETGGHGKPSDCVSHHRVAIIIPYRDRERQLRAFLHNLHSLLTKQQLDYSIFIVEQIANQTFNRAKLMNIGFVEANKLYDWQCYIFHDVDLLPEDDRNLYTCPDQPRHMSVGVDKFNYKLVIKFSGKVLFRLLYNSLFGGITAFTKDQFSKVNGYSNDYWGWGGEDDDMSSRVTMNGYKLSRYPTNIARYKMIKHSHETSNPVNACRYKLMYKTKRRWKSDGLNSLNYKLVSRSFEPMYTRFTVDLLENESKKEFTKAGIKC